MAYGQYGFQKGTRAQGLHYGPTEDVECTEDATVDNNVGQDPFDGIYNTSLI